jgi:Alcohol dehydrogenase GroES-like domain
MKAIQFSRFGGPEVLEYVDLPRPVPKGDEVIIEVTASGVNFPDIRQRTGVYQRAETHVGGVTVPYVTGLQVVGKVIEVGPEGNRTLDGKKVLAFLPQGGGYAQIAKASSGMAVPLPESVDDVQMAALPTQGLTAYLMLTALTKLTKGESILFTVPLGASEAWQFRSQRSWGQVRSLPLPARRKRGSIPGPSVLIFLSITKNLTGQKPFWSTRMDAELMSFWSRSVGISLSRISNAWPFSVATSFSVQRGDLVNLSSRAG